MNKNLFNKKLTNDINQYIKILSLNSILVKFSKKKVIFEKKKIIIKCENLTEKRKKSTNEIETNKLLKKITFSRLK